MRSVSTKKKPQERYSKIARKMWSDARFRALSSAPPNGQTLFLRLLCGPELNNIPGLFVAGEAMLAEALGWPLKGFRDVFAEVEAQGLVKADREARLVWVPKAFRYNPPDSPNVVKSWKVQWAELPECDLKAEALCSMREAFAKGFGEAFQEAFREALGEAFREGARTSGVHPSGNQEQEQEQEQEQDRESAPRSRQLSLAIVIDRQMVMPELCRKTFAERIALRQPPPPGVTCESAWRGFVSHYAGQSFANAKALDGRWSHWIDIERGETARTPSVVAGRAPTQVPEDGRWEAPRAIS